MDAATRQTFEEYLKQRYATAAAITLGQKLAAVRALKQEREMEGKVPIAPGQIIRLPVDNRAVRAVLDGKAVSVGGTDVSAQTRGGLAGASTPVKVAVLLLPMLLIPLLLWGLHSLTGSKSRTTETQVGTVITSTVTITPTVTMMPSDTPTPQPTITATVALPTPTPFNVSLYLTGDAPDKANDPASVQLGGYSFVLSEGEVGKNGLWVPHGGSEWLAGTEVRRVIGIPWERKPVAAIERMKAGDTIELRLRSGEVVNYTVDTVERVKRHQIELLSEKTPGLVILLYGERTGERTLVLADAVQRPEDFLVYTPVPITATHTVSRTATATPVPQTTVTTVTTHTVVTNTVAGLRLVVNSCRRAGQIGVETAPRGQDFVICALQMTAVATATVPYNGDALAITEYGLITERVNWWPDEVAVPDSPGYGVLQPGTAVSGSVAGLVSSAKDGFSLPFGKTADDPARPVLVWEQSGTRYVIDLRTFFETTKGGDSTGNTFVPPNLF